MKRSHALALSGAALFLGLAAPSYAQTVRSGPLCVPAVVNPSMYHNCRLRIVQGQEVCTCAIRPQALRRTDRLSDQRDAVTGSIGRNPAITPGAGSPIVGSPIVGSPGTVTDGRAPSRGGA